MFKIKFEVRGVKSADKVEVHSVPMLLLIARTYVSAIEMQHNIKFEYMYSMIDGFAESVDFKTPALPVTFTDEFLKITIDYKA